MNDRFNDIWNKLKSKVHFSKEVLYKYFGTNGTILTTVHLEDVYYIRMLSIMADDDK